MAVITQGAPRGAECRFGACGHAPATVTYTHEFAPHGVKYLCDACAAKVRNLGAVRKVIKERG